MNLALVTAPASTPVSLAEAKAHLRVLNTTEDTLISALIAAATQHLDGRMGALGRALVTQTWDYAVDAFPACGRALELPLPPLRSVSWLKYLDDAGVEQTLTAGTDYVVEAARFVGRVRLAYDKTWPATRAEPGAVRCRFVAGYGDAAEVPAPIRQAILLLVGHWWIHKTTLVESGNMPSPFAVEALTQPYRMAVL